MSFLPRKNDKLTELKGESPQHIKYIVSQEIYYELFLASFVSNPEKPKKYWGKIKTIISKILIKRSC